MLVFNLARLSTQRSGGVTVALPFQAAAPAAVTATMYVVGTTLPDVCFPCSMLVFPVFFLGLSLLFQQQHLLLFQNTEEDLAFLPEYCQLVRLTRQQLCFCMCVRMV